MSYLESVKNYILNLSQADACLYGLLFLFLVIVVFKIFTKKKKLKRSKYRNKRLAAKKTKYYNTGFNAGLCLWDYFKFRIRLGDYCDKKGCRYQYYFLFKLFNFEIIRMKYTDQKGQVFKRKIKLGK